MTYMQTIYCSQCGISEFFPFELEWRVVESSCNKCGADTSHYVKRWFCSWICLFNWVNANVNHKEHEFEPSPFMPSRSFCKICGEEK